MTFLIAAMAAAQLVASSPQGAQAPSSSPPGPTSERRLFRIRSHDAWELVQKRLTELGLAPDKVDRANQAVLTKWRPVDAKGMDWLPAPALPKEYAARRIRFEVFVSPFAEPARVYVGSLIEAKKLHSADRANAYNTGSLIEAKRLHSAARANAYNVANVNNALMSELAKALGQEGQAIPPDREQRRQLALSILGDEADDCLRNGPPIGEMTTPPRKIGLSEFEFYYPAPAVKERAQGTVQVEFMILEDGGVADMHLLGSPLGRQFDASGMGPASLLLYSPATRNGCPIPSVMTYTLRYETR